MSATVADLETWIEDMMRKKGVSDYKVDVSGASSKGDGYLGEVNFVKVVVKDDDQVYDLVVKSAKKGDEFRKQTPINEAYSREMYMYTKVFPAYADLQLHHNVPDPFRGFPKCYSVCDETNREALILRNLKTAGFEIHDRTLPQNLKHASFVFSNYGRYHGVSVALKRLKPAVFSNLTNDLSDVLGKFIKMSQMEKKFRDDFVDVLGAMRRRGKGVEAGKLEGFVEEIEDVLTNFKDEDHKCSVITHGDCWNNNMMFKYEGVDKTVPTDMCFIDFQLSRLASPIFDLSYYLYSVADRAVLDHFDALLATYHDSLSRFLADFDVDVADVATLPELKENWKKYGKFGLAMAPFIVKIELCQTDEVVDMAECAEKGNLQSAFDIKIKDQDVYEDRMVQVMEHWVREFC